MASSMPSILLLPVLTFTTTAASSAGADDSMVHLHFYMHENVTGPSPIDLGPRRQAPVPLPDSPYNFGDLVVVDDLLTDCPSAASRALRPVGRAQGTFTVARSEPSVQFVLNLVLADEARNGSTVACMGRDLAVATVRELAVVGGSGAFRKARGYAPREDALGQRHHRDAVLELDVYAESTTASGETLLAILPRFLPF